MNVDSAHLSLVGNRQDNQDRVGVIEDADTLLLVAVDGMGGHANGERAAEVTVTTLQQCFSSVARPIFDPQGFLALALSMAHEEVVRLAPDLALDHKPRATCAACLVQDSGAYWGHVGDSRIYHVRGSAIRERTRDHSHMELLLREGRITEEGIKDHPMRNYVECCLGGDVALPNMSITAQKKLLPGDVLIVCTDGFWSGLEETELIHEVNDTTRSLEDALRVLAETAVGRNAPSSDNSSAAALRWLD